MEASEESSPTLDVVPDDDERDQIARGLAVGRRMEELGLSKSGFARRAHLDRGTLERIITGQDGVRKVSLIAAEKAIEDFDHEVSPPVPARPTVRFVVEGFYGARSLVVEGPVENIAEMEESLARIIRMGESSSGITTDAAPEDEGC